MGKNVSSMDTEELNEHIEKHGDALGSESSGSNYQSSYMESLSNYETESNSYRQINKNLVEIEI